MSWSFTSKIFRIKLIFKNCGYLFYVASWKTFYFRLIDKSNNTLWHFLYHILHQLLISTMPLLRILIDVRVWGWYSVEEHVDFLNHSSYTVFIFIMHDFIMQYQKILRFLSAIILFTIGTYFSKIVRSSVMLLLPLSIVSCLLYIYNKIVIRLCKW
jgi:hypothetical protein